MANTNPMTNIAYGYVAAYALHPDVVHELMYGFGAINESYLTDLQQASNKSEEEWQEECDELATKCAEEGTDYVPPEFSFDLDEFNDSFECDEPSIHGVFEGVSYRSSWLGGALNFFILQSPVTTDVGNRASPCVPGACILKKDMAGNVAGYSVPDDWWNE